MAFHMGSEHTNRTAYSDFVNTIQDYENDDEPPRTRIPQTAASYETDSEEDDESYEDENEEEYDEEYEEEYDDDDDAGEYDDDDVDEFAEDVDEDEDDYEEEDDELEHDMDEDDYEDGEVDYDDEDEDDEVYDEGYDDEEVDGEYDEDGDEEYGEEGDEEYDEEYGEEGDEEYDEEYGEEGSEEFDDDDGEEDDDEDYDDEMDDDDSEQVSDSEEDEEQDDEDEINTFGFGDSFDAADSDSDGDMFDDEEISPFASANANRYALTQREQLIRDREKAVNVRERTATRWVIMIVALICCGAAAILVLYFVGVGPFKEDNSPVESRSNSPSVESPPETSPPTATPISEPSPSPSSLSSQSPTFSTRPTTTISSLPTVSLQPSDFPEIPEYIVGPKYQVLVPGVGNSLSIELLSSDLIGLMDNLAPVVFAEYTASASENKRKLRGISRKLLSGSIKLPTSLDMVDSIDCPVLAAPGSLCVEVIANVVVVSNDISLPELIGYEAALVEALRSNRLSDFLDEIGSINEIIVFEVDDSSLNLPSASPSLSPSSIGIPSSPLSDTSKAPSIFPSATPSEMGLPTNGAPPSDDGSSYPSLPPTISESPTLDELNGTIVPSDSPTIFSFNETSEFPSLAPTNETDLGDALNETDASDAPTISPTDEDFATPTIDDTGFNSTEPSSSPTFDDMDSNFTDPSSAPTSDDIDSNTTDFSGDDESQAPSTNETESPTQSPSMAPTVEPVRYFAIAGETNVLGWGDLNHLITLSFQDEKYRKFISSSFQPIEREDAFVFFENSYDDFLSQEVGKLSTLFGADGGHFGPELSFGFRLGDIFDEDIVIVKGGGQSALADKWLPPSSNPDGTPGEFYEKLLDNINDAIGDVDQVTASDGPPAYLAGVIWFHGLSDAFNEPSRNAYEVNLQNFISDLRSDLDRPTLPFVVVELGSGGANARQEELEMRAIQERVVNANNYTALTRTAQFITFDTEDPSQVFGGRDRYYSRADVLVSIGEEMADDFVRATTAHAVQPEEDPGVIVL